MVDIHNVDNRIANAKKHFGETCKDCYRLMERFEKDLKANNFSKQRVLKYWKTVRANHRLMNVCYEKATADDIKNLVIAINEKDDWTETTKADKKLLLKIFYRWLKNNALNGDYPDIVKWILARPKVNKEKPPESILTPDDVDRIANATEDQEERAFVLTLFWSGCRISELLNLKISDIEPSKVGHLLNVTGKTGPRKVRLLSEQSCKELDRWLSEHPSKNNLESYVFVKSYAGKVMILRRDYVAHRIKKIAESIGIRKPVNPHAFRFGLATHFGSKDISERVMNAHFGWTKNSDQAAHYTNLSRKQIDDVLLRRVKGVELGENENIQKQDIKCLRCGKLNEHFEDFCKECKFPLSLKGVAEYDDLIYMKVETLQKKMKAVSKSLLYLINQDNEIKSKFLSYVKQEDLESLFET